MRRKFLACLLMLPALLLALSATGLVPALSVSGGWILTATMELPDVGSCDYEGAAQISQDGASFNGTAELALVDGSESCPATLSGDISGTISGDTIEIGLITDGEDGSATFTGSLVLKATGPLQGSATVNAGPFNGTTSTWAATPLSAVTAIPVLGTWGTITLASLLFLGGIFLLWRRS